jgi:hypothetical protein
VILASGTAFTTLVATAVVLSGSGGLAGVTPSLLGSFPSGGLSGGLGAYTIPTMVGGGIVYAAALTLPGLVYLRGASGVYLRAIEGLDLVAAQEALREKVTAAQARAKEFQVQAQATAQQYAQRAHAPAPAVVGAGPIADVIPALSSACPACATTVVPGDVFCGSCGHRLV